MPPFPIILIRGGGDLASGTALRLVRAGFEVVITEIAAPLAVRRTVSFAEAVYDGRVRVEGVPGVLAAGPAEAVKTLAVGGIPIIVDPELDLLEKPGGLEICAVVDARLLKRPVPPLEAPFVVGLGPGFTPGVNCDAVVETMRGHHLGRVYFDRPAAADTGLPEGSPDRVVRAPANGAVQPAVAIGDLVELGERIGAVVDDSGGEIPILAGIGGVVRGMVRPGIRVEAGVKIGDIDARADPALCRLVSDKALAVAGGILEALLSKPDLRRLLAATAEAPWG
ncbi:MAG TPA: selenium-dependent molybdenum cofactor biosynthesis protein YqeB [Anaerolineales bacterium]|nr:selenium-dependent molybdenum cofactor biosynthesis protein YqeB [Anaerolineales bacterium]